MTLKIASTAALLLAFATGGAATAQEGAHQPGQPSVLITVGGGGDTTLDCPSPTDPDRKCSTHAFAWESAPTVEDSAEILKRAGRRDGVSLMECGAGEGGALVQCTITGDTPEDTRAVMTQLAGEFRAPATAVDGTPLAQGRILLSWDWEKIMRGVRRGSR